MNKGYYVVSANPVRYVANENGRLTKLKTKADIFKDKREFMFINQEVFIERRDYINSVFIDGIYMVSIDLMRKAYKYFTRRKVITGNALRLKNTDEGIKMSLQDHNLCIKAKEGIDYYTIVPKSVYDKYIDWDF